MIDVKIEPGDIIFTKDNSLLSKAIRLVETGKPGQDVPSHCGVVHCVCYYDNDLMVYTIEALFSGVRYHVFNNYYKKGTHVWVYRPKDGRDPEEGLDWLEKQVFINYDIPQLIGILIHALVRYVVQRIGRRTPTLSRFLKRIGRRTPTLSRFLNSKRRFICSELVEIYGEKTGGRFWHGPIEYVTPYDIFRSPALSCILNKQC